MNLIAAILLTSLALQGCAAAPRDTFATPPSPERPAAATDYGVDIPTGDEPVEEGAKPPRP